MITHVQRLSICAERPVKIIEELHCKSAEKLNLRFILTNALRLGAKLYMQRLICFFKSVCKPTSQWICSQYQPICQPALLSNAICRRLKSQCFCMCIVGIFFKDNVNEWVTFACDGTGPADESKKTKRIQGWSRLNWLGGILIIVS